MMETIAISASCETSLFYVEIMKEETKIKLMFIVLIMCSRNIIIPFIHYHRLQKFHKNQTLCIERYVIESIKKKALQSLMAVTVEIKKAQIHFA